MLKLISALMILASALPAFAGSYAITSADKRESRYVKVTDHGPAVSFELCDRISKACEQIGRRARYTKKYVVQQRLIEYVRTVPVVAADAGLVVLAFVAGTRAVAAAPQGYATLIIAKRIGAGLIAATLSQVAAWSTKYLNPIVYPRRANSAGRALNGPSEVKDIVRFSHQLEDFLDQMEIRWGFIPWI